MVFEIINRLLDSAFMTVASETMGLFILCVKLFGVGFIAYYLLKLVFQKKSEKK